MNLNEKNKKSEYTGVIRDEELNEEIIKVIEEAERGENIFGSFHSVEELFEDLDRED